MGMNKRIVILLNACAFVLLTVFIILHVNDHHKIRLSLMEINEESSEKVFDWVPGRPLAGFREDKVTDLLDFRNESVQWIGHAKTDLSFEDSLTLMRGLCSLNPEHSGEMNRAIHRGLFYLICGKEGDLQIVVISPYF